MHLMKMCLCMSSLEGDIKFLESICDYYKREYGVGYKPTDIVVTMGASEALTMTFTTIIDPGDEILIAEPFYSIIRPLHLLEVEI